MRAGHNRVTYRCTMSFLVAWTGTASLAVHGVKMCRSWGWTAAKTTNVMRGGIGASWHAIEQPIPYSDKPAIRSLAA